MARNVTRSPTFLNDTKHLDTFLLQRLEKQIQKILTDPSVGKPLRYTRGERVLYVKPFRLVYSIRGDEIVLLKFEHRKSVYK